MLQVGGVSESPVTEVPCVVYEFVASVDGVQRSLNFSMLEWDQAT